MILLSRVILGNAVCSNCNVQICFERGQRYDHSNQSQRLRPSLNTFDGACGPRGFHTLDFTDGSLSDLPGKIRDLLCMCQGFFSVHPGAFSFSFTFLRSLLYFGSLHLVPLAAFPVISSFSRLFFFSPFAMARVIVFSRIREEKSVRVLVPGPLSSSFIKSPPCSLKLTFGCSFCRPLLQILTYSSCQKFQHMSSHTDMSLMPKPLLAPKATLNIRRYQLVRIVM